MSETSSPPTSILLRHRIEYLLWRAFRALAGILPQWGAALTASALSWIAYALDRKHVRIMTRQMRLAFGSAPSEAELNRIARGCFRHEVFCILDLARIPRLGREKIHGRFDLSPFKDLPRPGPGNPGALLVSGHFGPWDMALLALGAEGIPLTGMARPMKNPLLDADLQRIRMLSGGCMVSKFGTIRALGRALENGEWGCLMYDQNGGPDDAFVPFFGIPAATWRSAAFLQWKTGVPIYVVSPARENWLGTRMTLHVRRVLPPREGESREVAEGRILREINGGFEEAIRAYPGQWMWQHRRWKTRPPGERSRLVDGVPVFEVKG